ncbi:Ldh family oxidoreductase [Arthrobacter sp. BE255]|uniref:Ldh family oxidoreductase n=1 Tax=Arthrobacter sp. BE255 TaxID=2817721 RepID=UPI0028549940|nr:Ldh family oxidoreductase [Arthrobacter sp. BE255]MDR7159057.1 LDH2 family malate/lactate/ureidoglycolate dehydrogenase [Arthrobacter sp. BE255]
MTEPRTAPTQLIDFASAVLRAEGVPAKDAHLVADSLVQAELWGHQSHGLLRLPWYVARLRSGAVTPLTRPQVVLDSDSMLVLDGRHGIGQVLAEIARREAVERAREHGIAMVGVRNSNHFGTAQYYTRRAAQDGCVAFLTTNSSPAMAPWGGRKKTLGANPWSIAAPAPTPGGVVVADLSNTAAARGKMFLARDRGEPIPADWALDANGVPTTDPAAALDGLIQPIAGPKGYAITFMMDVLAGALTGSQTGTRVNGPYDPDKQSGVGHLMIAIDVASLGETRSYMAAVQQLVDETKAAPLAEGTEEIFYPGEHAERHQQTVLATGGVRLPAKIRAELESLAADAGIESPFTAQPQNITR